jgi:SpoVK/Ycf46/Vps4 family AAA+-type ATPase
MIEALKEALAVSPNNVPLRMSLANLLLTNDQYNEAATHFKEILQQSYGNQEAQTGLAKCYFFLGSYSAASVIYEQLEGHLADPDLKIYVQCLVKENNLEKAAELYQSLVVFNHAMADPELDLLFRLPSAHADADDFDFDDEDEASLFLERPSINFSHVGGMQKVKDEIGLKIIQPLQHPEIYKAYGKKIGGGILLYGPPGCGKTFIARATAGEIESQFISVGLHDILDMWIGNSEKNLHQIFDTARRNTPCVLFIDEVDALGASRADLKQSAMRHTINQFLAEMDGIADQNEGVLILAATNAPWSVDSAFRRPGRFDRLIFVPPPDEASREEILKAQLKDKPVEAIDYKKIAAATAEFSGADLAAVIDLAVEEKLGVSLKTGVLSPLATKDLLLAAKKHHPTTKEWFATARNYALYSNDTGQYNDILEYINKRKL